MHKILGWLSENFVPAWKALSILLTGGFGILGLLKNFKEKGVDSETDAPVERITKWGWISLTGIILSTSLGVVAQLKETHDDTKKSLELATKADHTLDVIERSLHPIEAPQFIYDLSVPCEQKEHPEYKDFCEDVLQNHSYGEPRKFWKRWPYTEMPDAAGVAVFKHEKDAHLAVEGINDQVKIQTLIHTSDLSFLVGGKDWAVFEKDGRVRLMAVGTEPKSMSNPGGITSMRDLRGSTIVVAFSTASLHGLELIGFSIVSRSGEFVRTEGKSHGEALKHETGQSNTFYEYTVAP